MLPSIKGSTAGERWNLTKGDGGGERHRRVQFRSLRALALVDQRAVAEQYRTLSSTFGSATFQAQTRQSSRYWATSRTAGASFRFTPSMAGNLFRTGSIE